MIRAIAAVLAASTITLAAPAYADPPAPVQCKPTGGSFGQNVCRYPDGSVMICGLTGCHPMFTQLAPGFWDQP